MTTYIFRSLACLTLFISLISTAEGKTPRYLVIWLDDHPMSSLEFKLKQTQKLIPRWISQGESREKLLPFAVKIARHRKRHEFYQGEKVVDILLSIVAKSAPRKSSIEYLKESLDRDMAWQIKLLGTRGDGVKTQLAFGLSLPTFVVEKYLPEIIPMAFSLAKKHHVALFLHFDTHLHWKNRRDLWSRPENVEAQNWKGTRPSHRYVPTQKGWMALAPPMCYNSPAIQREVTRLAHQVIGRIVAKEVQTLRKEKKDHLFAGVAMGSNPSHEDYRTLSRTSPLRRHWKKQGIKPYQLGYQALMNRGFSASKSPGQMSRELAQVSRDFLALWCRHLVRAGVSRKKIYTFITTHSKADLRFHRVPLSVAFNRYSRPGFSTLPRGWYQKNLQLISLSLLSHQATNWGAVESQAHLATNHRDWERYLWQHLNRNAALVAVRTQSLWPRRQSIWPNSTSKATLAIWAKFLRGKDLSPNGSAQSPTNLARRIQKKLELLEKHLPQWRSRGGSSSLAHRHLVELKRIMRERGNSPELEKQLDEILKQVGPSSPSSTPMERRVIAKWQNVQMLLPSWRQRGGQFQMIAPMFYQVQSAINQGDFRRAEPLLDQLIIILNNPPL